MRVWMGLLLTVAVSLLPAGGAGLVAAAPVAGGPAYAIVDLGPGAAHAINDRGQVVGESGGHAALWQAGADLRDLGTLPGRSRSRAVGINDQGQVVGWSGTEDWPTAGTHAVLWQDGQVTDLGTLPGGTYSAATAINNQGQVVGWGDVAGGHVHAFVWEVGGGLRDLGTPPGAVARADVPGGSYTDSQAASINDRGQVVGSASLACCDFGRPTQAGFVWQAGTWTLLDFLPLVFTTDINALGQVVGAAAIEHAPTDTCCNAFVWQASTGPRPVPLGSAHAINNRGQIVGQPRFVNRAFVWQEGTQLQELGTLGGCCSDAEGITNGGQVAGWSTTAAGEAHAVLWEPAR